MAIAGLATVALAASGDAQSVTTYHGSANRSGLYVTPGLNWAQAANVTMDTAFAATVEGDIYAQPLYWVPPGSKTGWLIVATESDVVYALNPDTGKVAWRRVLGTPIPLGNLPCGNINPVGITGTPVIDPAAGTLYLDALVLQDGKPHHLIFAISLATGQDLPGFPLGVQLGMQRLGHGFNPATQGQRSALAIANGLVYVTYAGNWGDCGTYHGTVVQLPLGTAQLTGAWMTQAHGGGIWGKSGIASDGTSLYVATGNTMGAHTWAGGEAVIRLLPGLARATSKTDFFTPRNWSDLDNEDLDLGGTGPIPVDVPASGGTTLPRLLQLGKDGNAYLLDRTELGGIGGQLAVTSVSSNEIISAATTFSTAAAAMVAFVGPGSACPAGQPSGNLTMLKITASTKQPISTAWCANLNGNGAPIVTTTDGTSFPIVWVVGSQGDNQLHGFRGTDGAPLFSGGNLSGMQRNTTILVANNRFYIAGSGQVFAFKL